MAFIKSQREKVGSKGGHQIAGIDVIEHNRQVKADLRKNTKLLIEEKRKKKGEEEKEKKEQSKIIFYEVEKEQDKMEAEQGCSDDMEIEEGLQYTINSGVKDKKYNTKNIDNVALTSL